MKLNEQLWHKKMSQQDFLQCVNEGMTIEEIKNKYGYSRRQQILTLSKRLTIYDLLKSREEMPKGGTKSKYDKTSILEEIKKGKSYEEIMNKFGCSYTTAKRVAHNNNLHVLKKKNRILDIEFTDDEFQVLYGTLLGDAHLLKKTNNAQGSFNHCIDQIEYAMHKQYLLNRFIKEVKIVKKVDNRYTPSKKYEQAYCYIKASTALNNLYSKIYKNKIKYIDKDLLYKLDGRGIAIWYMDDGSYDDYGYILCTESYSNEDVQLVQQFFKDKFNINTSIRKNNEIYIKADSKEKFKDLIKPYIIPSMEYKL